MISPYRIYHFIEATYWRKGIYVPEIRQILVCQTVLICIACIFGVISSCYSLWGLWFAFGAVMSLWNFYMLIKHTIKILERRPLSQAVLIPSLINTNMRLLITGSLGYIALVKVYAPISALLLGFSSSILCIICITGKSLLVTMWLFFTNRNRNK